MTTSLQVDSQTPSAYFQQANQFKLSGKLEEAVLAYRQCISLNPNFAWYHHNLGEVLALLGQWEEADRAYQCACELNPNSAFSYHNWGDVLEQQGKLAQALAAYRRAVEISADFYEFHSSLGKALCLQGQLEEAIASLQKAIELDEESALPYQYLWEAFAKQGQVDEGLVCLRKAIDLNPGSSDLYLKLGEALQGKNEFAEALRSYRKGIQLNPDFYWLHYKLGTALAALGQLEDAIASYRKAADLEPGAAIVHHYLGYTLALLGRWDDAIVSYRQTLEISPDAAVVYQHLGDALSAQQKWEQAVDAYRKSVEIEPTSLEAEDHLGFALYQLGRYDEAILAYRKALELSPNSDVVNLHLGDALAALQWWDEALESYNRAFQLNPDNQEIYTRLGQILEKKKELITRNFHRLYISSPEDIYGRWLEENSPSLADLGRMPKTVKTFSYKPLISVIMPVYNAPESFLREAIESVIDQIYPYWQLCIADDASPQAHVKSILEEYAARDGRIKVVFRPENGHISACSNSALAVATGEFISLLDHDDVLTPDALYEVALFLNRHPEADMIYSDEDFITEAGYITNPYIKPDWCPDSFLSRMYVCHLGTYRRAMVNQVGGFRVGYEGSQDYDLVLRFTEKTQNIFHIPKVLYHWRVHSASVASGSGVKSYAYEAGKKALTEALRRRGENGKVIVRNDQFRGVYTIRYKITNDKLVSIVIPTKNRGNLLDKNLTSIFEKSTYANYEVILINNGSDEQETATIIAAWKYHETHRFKCYDLDIPFNYSHLNNYAVSKAKGEYLLFLNDDTEVITSDWIDAMVEQAQRPTIGAVGALLLYPDNRIQHAGVILGIGGVAGHSHRYFPAQDAGYAHQIICTNNYSALTGACLMCRRDLFEKVGGFDEQLSVAYNDVDLCLKILQHGYYNVYLPHVVLYHHELKSWANEATSTKQSQYQQEAEIIKKRWGKIIENDPCYSPNLTRDREDYSWRWK
jgi:O-antigen biosynthesis protein